MAFSLKKAAIAVVKLPGTIVSGIFDLIFGYKDKEGQNKDGLLGLLMDGIKAVGRGISTFIKDHTKLIAAAFWLSLATGVAAGLTLFLWPAALTAVATFSVYGFSIAGIVGANALAQIGFAAGLAFAATSVLTYTVGTVVNLISWLVNACTGNNGDKQPTHTSPQESKNASEYLKSNEHEHCRITGLGHPNPVS